MRNVCNVLYLSPLYANVFQSSVQNCVERESLCDANNVVLHSNTKQEIIISDPIACNVQSCNYNYYQSMQCNV